MSSGSAVFYYRHPTAAGPVFLFPETDGRYQIIFREEIFGTYRSVQEAADEASENLSVLEVSSDIADWDKRLYAYVPGTRTA